MTDLRLVVCNVPDAAVGEAIARALIEEGLAACVNLLPGVRSIYRWQGAVEQADEFTLLVKTVMQRQQQVQKRIADLHPYDIPEILVLSVADGLPAYLQWVRDETSPPFMEA